MQDSSLLNATSMVLFDMPSVVRTLYYEATFATGANDDFHYNEAFALGSNLDYMDTSDTNMRLLLCGKLGEWTPTRFLPNTRAETPCACLEIVADAYILTTDQQPELPVRVWREASLPGVAICTNAEKALLSRLLRKPTLLFGTTNKLVNRHICAFHGNDGYMVLDDGAGSNKPHTQRIRKLPRDRWPSIAVTFAEKHGVF